MEHTDEHTVATHTVLSGEQYHACTEEGCSWIAVTLPDEALDAMLDDEGEAVQDLEKERRFRAAGYPNESVVSLRTDVAQARQIGREDLVDAIEKDWTAIKDSPSYENLFGAMGLVHAAFCDPNLPVEIKHQIGPYVLTLSLTMPDPA